MAGLADIIYELKNEKGLSEDLVKIVIEDFLNAAYKKRFGTDENTSIIFNDDNSEVTLYSKKTIVSEVENSVLEISFEEAKQLEPECDIGDQLLMEINPREFSRSEILVANQRAIQRLREFESDSLQSEFKNKIGEIIVGYCLRENNKNIIVDLGKVEGILPKRFQSVKEVYRPGDRIKALIHSAERSSGNRLEVILSRTHPEFVKKIFEIEVPELYDGTVEIVKLVREPGYRTKIAVRSLHSEVDPIGTCVGAKGSRINNVMLELDNERIDVLRYDNDPLTFIHNALSPAEIKQVVVLDYAKRSVIAIVEDENFPIAIGKLGLNVRLANRLTDWNINVKTETEFKEMSESTEILKNVFNDVSSKDEGAEIDISKVDELPGIREDITKKLKEANIEYIEDLLQISNAQLIEQGFMRDEIIHVREILKEVIELDDEMDVSFENGENGSSADDTMGDDDDLEIDDGATGDTGYDIDISALPISDEIRKKLMNAKITKLYDLVVLYSNNALDSLEDFTDQEKDEITQAIKDNVDYEEE